MFGLQFYGECWAGPDEEVRHKMYGETDQCFQKLANPIVTECDVKAPEECMGQLNENYVYRLKIGKHKD